jgi:transcriptional regulator with GAF, ATPase, and Fis domain
MLAGMSDRPGSKAEGRLICAPLATLHSRIGVLYVSGSSSASPFDSHDLEFLTAFGSVAGVAIDEVRTVERLQEDRSRLLDEVAVQHEMVGESASMRAVYDFIGKAASADSTILIESESGTGKELVAWAIHQNSLRANGPFVAINCAALPADLLESELFGYEKGAFTGANALKKGRFEAASGGTLFLDEIAELPIGIQAKLLRVVQTRSFERLGGVATINADVRIVAATNRDLRKAKDEGRFREDLYFRINVVAVALPPLRDRREDIRPLAEHFARRMAAREGRVLTISPQTHQLMANYDWPGNVRELENAIERAVVLGAGDELMLDDLPETLLEGRPSGEDPLNYQDAVNRFKREHILRVIHQTDQLRDAARLLGIHPNNLSRLIRQLELRPDLDEAE